MITLTWAEMKNMLDAGVNFKGTIDDNQNWLIICVDHNVTYICVIPDDLASEYKNNYHANSSVLLGV